MAQDAIKRLKIGPRSLDTAYLLSNVLTTRKVQCEMNSETIRRKKEQHLLDGQETIQQAEQWCEDQKEKMLEKRRTIDDYKKELKMNCLEDEYRRLEKSRQQAELERQYRETAENDLKVQLEKERLILQRKKDTQRRHALEAMRMAEERRLSKFFKIKFYQRNKYNFFFLNNLGNKMVDEIENKMITIFAKGNNIAEIRKKNENEVNAEKDRLRTSIARKIFADFSDVNEKEEETYQNAVVELNAKYEKQEQNRLDHVKKMKAARIQQHLDEMEHVKQAKQRQHDQAQWELANRIKNEEVNVEYDRQRRSMETRKALVNRQFVEKQMYTNAIRTEAKDQLQFIKETEVEDDKNFFEYANELIEEATEKKRPILPLIRVVDTYKKENGLIPQKDNLPHLKTNINVGLSKSLNENKIKYEINVLKRFNRGVTPPIVVDTMRNSPVCKNLPWKMSYWRNKRFYPDN